MRVLAAIASGVLSGLLLVLVVAGGGPEHEITGAALLALGAGFAVLARRWAIVPGAASALAGLAVWVLAPGDHLLALAGWAWPALLLIVVGSSVHGARRTHPAWSRRTLLYPALAVLALVALGGAYETAVEAAASKTPHSGRTYRVNGHRLYLDCVGRGTPTVVLFNGLGERAPSWAWVQRTVSSSTRVCSYDRAGEGWSDGTPGARDGHALSSDLHGLLHAAHVRGPYVLAGHSIGGIHALLYAARHPEQVAGVALIDSATPYQFELPDYPGFYSMWRRISALLPSFARAGLTRTSPRELRADRVELAQLPGLLQEARAVQSLGARPLLVVTAGAGAQRGWPAAQARLATLSSRSARWTVAGATHAALLEDEGFARITSRAVVQIVREARARG